MLSNGIHIGRRGVRLTGGGGETPWWLAGGISAGDVVAAYQPKGAASLAASYVNLANPGTYDAAPGVAPTFNAATGWTFNGTTQYLTTGIVPTQDYTLIARFANAANTGYPMGFSTTKSLAFAPLRGPGSTVRWLHGSVVIDTSPGLTAGVLAIAGPNRYRNGAADGSITPEVFTAAYAMLLGCIINNANAPSLFFAGDIIAAVIASSTLTAGQVAALSTAMAAL